MAKKIALAWQYSLAVSLYNGWDLAKDYWKIIYLPNGDFLHSQQGLHVERVLSISFSSALGGNESSKW